MRWDRLFAELEQQAVDEERIERDELASDLRDELWSSTGWRELLGGDVELDVLGAGRVSGFVRWSSDTIVQLSRAAHDVLVAADAVMAVESSQRRGSPASEVTRRLGWGPVLRAARDEALPVTVLRRDGRTYEGYVELVGADFVRLTSSAGRVVDVLWSALALVRLPH